MRMMPHCRVDRKGELMKRRLIPGTDLEVSQLCYGTAGFGSAVTDEQVDALLDGFRSAGGNFLDTAHVYAMWCDAGAGASERAIASYLSRSGSRKEWIIGTKGGHPATPRYPRGDDYLSPEQIGSDIDDSLGWLNADVIDLYWLHRDDPQREVGEIIETLNAEIARGRIRHLGASNWTCARLEAANAYAAEHGLQPFVASQPQWSLAHREPFPMGRGNMVFLGREDADWHERTGLPVVCWTPTAGGYFATGETKRKDIDNETTHGRLIRARQLAAELSCTPNQVALAYLMSHPFPAIPIIGTANLEHQTDAIGATEISLSREQVAWLRDG
jgi:1-deoxyxylulose-5-phosphate synthase